MQGEKIRDLVYDLARDIVERQQMELVAVEYVKEGANWYLRLYIDKEGGVDHEDCGTISNLISDLLDEKDPIQHAYFLEVSSPGIERIIQTDKDFAKYRGQAVAVHTYLPVNGQKKLSGLLVDKSKDCLTLQAADGGLVEISADKIAQVRLAWEK